MRSLIFIFIFIWSFQIQAQTCEGVFSTELSRLEKLALSDSVSETQIFKAARKDILANRSVSQRSQDWILQYFELFQMNKNFKRQLSLEIQQRDYKAVLRDLGIKTYVDPLSILRKNKHYFSWVFSLAANSAVNYLSYHYLGTAGVVVHLPTSRFFKAEEIPDNVIEEILTQPEAGPLTKNYLRSRVKHGSDIVIGSIRKYFNAAIFTTFVIFQHQMVTDPQGYIQSQVAMSISGVRDAAYLMNIETIKKIEIKKDEFRRNGEPGKFEKAEELIEKIKLQNQSLLNE